MSNKKTSVNWLIDEIDNKDIGEVPMWIYDIIKQAKQMEKEQIKDAYEAGFNERDEKANTDCELYTTPEQYYTQTYES